MPVLVQPPVVIAGSDALPADVPEPTLILVAAYTDAAEHTIELPITVAPHMAVLPYIVVPVTVELNVPVVPDTVPPQIAVLPYIVVPVIVPVDATLAAQTAPEKQPTPVDVTVELP